MRLNIRNLLSSLALAALLFFTSCGKPSQNYDFDPEQIDQYFGKSDSVPRTADSLMSLGIIGPIAADVFLVDYYQSRNVPKALDILDSGLSLPVVTAQDRFYNFLLNTESVEIEVIDRRYESGLHKVLPLIENADMDFVNSHYLLQSAYVNLCTNMAKCDINLERFEQAEETLLKSMELLDQYIEEARDDSIKLGRFEFERAYTSVEALIAYFNINQFERTLAWIERAEKNLASFTQNPGNMEEFCTTFSYQIAIMKAAVLEKTGHSEEAAQVYEDALKNPFAESPVGRVNAVNYLLFAHRYDEAVRNIEPVESMIYQHGMKMTLDNLVGFVKMKFDANLEAGRRDSALAVATRLIMSLDSARAWAKRDRSAELASLYDMKEKEALLAEKEVSLMFTKVIALMITIVLLIIFFVVFSIIRHRVANRLAEVKAAQERIEGELQIARDIQMSMLPHEFPHRKGLDMYASMTPAKEVGGDLYGYVIRRNMLYFAVGDVSGKGIPASLFMAQVTRLFQTMAQQGMQPADICTRMNDTLSGEDNVSSMFVTMFIGMLDMTTGHLKFCNAGHNPPVIGGGENHGDFLQMETNAPIGLWPELEYVGEEIDTIKGRPLFVYTDGLNEAEDPEQNQFGEERLLNILRNTIFDTAQQVVENLKSQVDTHRRGAEPNDDLTMLCIHIDVPSAS